MEVNGQKCWTRARVLTKKVIDKVDWPEDRRDLFDSLILLSHGRWPHCFRTLLNLTLDSDAIKCMRSCLKWDGFFLNDCERTISCLYSKRGSSTKLHLKAPIYIYQS